VDPYSDRADTGESLMKSPGGMHGADFPLKIWMSGSGTTFNMNGLGRGYGRSVRRPGDECL
jgi:hypothetical protein